MNEITVPSPDLQIQYSFDIDTIRKYYLQEALFNTVDNIKLKVLNEELSEFAPEEGLNTLAKVGLRGEILFPTPYLLDKNPYLLGYYRLILGFSQKKFYTKENGLAHFQKMENKGKFGEKESSRFPELCKKMGESSYSLLNGIGRERLSSNLLHELSLLTVGPQLRGGSNVKKGTDAIEDVFNVVYDIVKDQISTQYKSKIEVVNAAGRTVVIAFSSDPDIVIYEIGKDDHIRKKIAIEVKGGSDFSNIHNRVGEAEKSHQKAKKVGYIECWTVVNVNRINEEISKDESPSTNRFYRISSLKLESGDEYNDFKNNIISLTGIKAE